MRLPKDAKILGDPATAGFRVEQSPFFQMNRTVGAYSLAMERALRAVDMDIPRWRVLMLAHERGPLSVGEISENGVLKLSTATRVVQRLRDEGLVKLRRSKSDARVTEVQTTSRGARAVAVIRSVASQVYRDAFTGLDGAVVEALNGTLARVQKNLRVGGG